jgi:hypothetical protein
MTRSSIAYGGVAAASLMAYCLLVAAFELLAR